MKQMSKYTIRVPLDQFAYLETEFEGTGEMAIAEYKSLTEAFKAPRNEGSGPGLPPKEWNAWIDRYLTDGKGNSDLFAQMSDEQQKIIKAIQLSMKRLKARPPEDEDTWGGGPGKGENGDWSNQD